MALTEAQEQAALIRWSQQPKIRERYPELALLFHIPNERKDAREAAQMKRMGVKPGVPDLFFPVARCGYHGLWIEMKTKRGIISDAQKWWFEKLGEQGYFVAVAYGWEDAVRCISAYLDWR